MLINFENPLYFFLFIILLVLYLFSRKSKKMVVPALFFWSLLDKSKRITTFFANSVIEFLILCLTMLAITSPFYKKDFQNNKDIITKADSENVKLDLYSLPYKEKGFFTFKITNGNTKKIENFFCWESVFKNKIGRASCRERV